MKFIKLCEAIRKEEKQVEKEKIRSKLAKISISFKKK